MSKIPAWGYVAIAGVLGWAWVHRANLKSTELGTRKSPYRSSGAHY